MLINAIIILFLGIIEGITEWMPISSTGHMMVFNALFPLNVTPKFMDVFLYVIQLGAILAVVVVLWKKMWPFRKKTPEHSIVKKPVLINWGKVALACVPGVIAERLVGDNIPDSPWLIAAMLIFYGAAFIVLEYWNAKRTPKYRRLFDIPWLVALGIGLFQVLAIVPGTSRSGATIIGALLLGVSRTAAVEFTFFLAVPVMVGMSGLKIFEYLKDGRFTGEQIFYLVLGAVIAFAVSLLVIRMVLNYIKKHDFKIFGWYRIGFGVLLLLLLLFVPSLFPA